MCLVKAMFELFVTNQIEFFFPDSTISICHRVGFYTTFRPYK